MKKLFNILSALIIAISTNCVVYAEDSSTFDIDESHILVTLAEMTNSGMLSETEVIVLDDNDDDVTAIFQNWYGEGKNEYDIANYLNINQFSFFQISSRDYTEKSINSFETKSASRTFVDRFYGTFAEQSNDILFSTTVSGTISYNSNTYDIVNVYGATVNSVYTGDYFKFVNFYAAGLSTSTSISADRTYGYVTGSCSLYANEYPDHPMTSKITLLGRVSHTLSISA